MFEIKTLNKISEKGMTLLPDNQYQIDREGKAPHAILVRSFKMHDMEMPETLMAIARAGAGTNNIPVDECTEKGIVVFNTPGANANSVKELVLFGLLVSSRKIMDGVSWVQGLVGTQDDVSKLVEKEKSRFVGPEITGKTLGIVGLGAIGVLVANAASALGMKVIGYDPYISIEAAWGLSSSVCRSDTLEALLGKSDYISIHAPLTDSTKEMFNKKTFEKAKKGIKLLNFARSGFVNNADLLSALDSGIVGCYVTDFPENDLLGNENIVTVPHLGASTPEAEDNCAIMAVEQLREYLEKGNIRNSVNFPNCSMDFQTATRIVIGNKNIPSMVNQITSILAEEGMNIAEMANRHRGDIAYTMIDLDDTIPETFEEKLKAIDGVFMVRIITQ